MGEYLRVETIRSSTDYYLMVADFLTEIRSRKIKDYRNQFAEKTNVQLLRSAGITETNIPLTDTQKKSILRVKIEDKEKEEMDRLQKSIITLEKGIIDSLVVSVPSVNLPKEKKVKFYREIIERAKLTIEEQHKLEIDK